MGVLKLRLWRPFPFDDFRKAVEGVEKLIVVDRAVSFGAGGPVASQLRSALYDEPNKPQMTNMIAGLGGRDVGPHDFVSMYNMSQDMFKKGAKEENFHFYGVSEGIMAEQTAKKAKPTVGKKTAGYVRGQESAL